jgi:hypothetical protein
LELDPGFAKRLADPKWADPLMLMMAALTAIETGLAPALLLNRPDLAKRVALCEAERIRRFARPSAITSPVADLLVHLAAFSTLCGGFPSAEEQSIGLVREECEAKGISHPDGAYGASKISGTHCRRPRLRFQRNRRVLRA